MLKKVLMCVLIALTLAGCSKPAEGALPTPLPEPTSSPTNAVIPINTPVPFPTIPAVTPTSGASPTAFTPFTVTSTVDNLKVRVNPGFLFEALMMVQTSDNLSVLGSAPGNEWTYIQTEGGAEGWVFTELLQSSVDLSQVPIRPPKNVLEVKGRVVDMAGTPIQGVGFDLVQNSGGEASTNRAITDASGNFYAFLPENASGTWSISYTAIACKSNVWSDSSCGTYKGSYTGNIDPPTQSITLPQSGEPVLFIWK